MSDPGQRVDQALVQRGLARSRAVAREYLDAGRVTCDGRPVRKASERVAGDQLLEVAGTTEPWVGRAAHKLLAALETFGPRGLSATGRDCLDVGASTGGFTQVLLAAGARHVVALDVGHGQLAPAVAGDPRVTERSGTSIRDVGPGDLGGPFALVVADLSFISLVLVLPRLAEQTAVDGDLVLLVKPQFEVGRHALGRTGVVRSQQQRAQVLRRVLATATGLGLHPHGLRASPVTGQQGNQEYLLWLARRTTGMMTTVQTDNAVTALARTGEPA